MNPEVVVGRDTVQFNSTKISFCFLLVNLELGFCSKLWVAAAFYKTDIQNNI